MQLQDNKKKVNTQVPVLGPAINIGKAELLTHSSEDIYQKDESIKTAPALGPALQLPSFKLDRNEFPEDNLDQSVTEDPVKEKIKGLAGDEDKMKAVDDEIQKLTTEKKNYWDKIKKDINPSESIEQRMARDPSFVPWSVKKQEIEQKINNLKSIRRDIKDKMVPTTPAVKSEIEPGLEVQFREDGKFTTPYLKNIQKYGENKVNRVERETLTDLNDNFWKSDIQNKEKIKDGLGMYSFNALKHGEKADISPEEMTDLEKLFNDSVKDPEYYGIGRSGTYDYTTKAKLLDKKVKDYIKKFEDPAIREKKYMDYSKVMGAIMQFDPQTGNPSVEGLKMYAASNQEQLQERFDEVASAKELMYSKEFNVNDSFPLRTIAKPDPGEDIKQNYENFEAYKQRIEKEYSILKGALEFNMKLLSLPEQKRRMRDLGKGLSQGNLVTDVLTLGINDMKRTFAVEKLASQMNGEEGFYEPTWSEAKILEMYSALQTANSKDTQGGWYQIGSGITNMVPYIATFAATKPIFSGAKSVIRKGITATADAVLADLKPSLVKSMTWKTGPKMATILGAKEINYAKVLADYSARAGAAAVQTAVLPQYYMKNISERLMPHIESSFNEDLTDIITHLDRNTKETTASGIAKGFMDAYWEIATEYSGTKLVKGLKVPGRALKTLIGKDINKAIILDKFFKLKGYKSFQEGADKILKGTLGWHGIKEEYLEELANQLAAYGTSGDRPADMKSFLHDQLVTFGTVALFGLPMSVVQSGTKYARFGTIGDEVAYSVKKEGEKKKKILIPQDVHQKLMTIFNEGEFIDGDKLTQLIEDHTSMPNKKDNLNKDQIEFVLDLTLQEGQKIHQRNLVTAALKKAGIKVQNDQGAQGLSKKENEENQDLLSKEDIDKIVKKNEQMRSKHKDLYDNDLLEIDNTGQMLPPTPEYLYEVRSVLNNEIEDKLIQNKDKSYKNLDVPTKEEIKVKESQINELSTAKGNEEKIDLLTREISNLKNTPPESSLDLQMKLKVVESELDKQADELGLSFNYKLPSEKNKILQEELSSGKTITGKADMVTDVKMLITLPDGRQLSAYVGPSAGINETNEQYRDRMKYIADKIFLKKSPVQLNLVRKEDWNAEDKAHEMISNPYTGEIVRIPYGDKIDVNIDGRTIAAVQITDYGEKQLRDSKYNKAKEMFKASMGDLIFRAAKKSGAVKQLTDVREKEIRKVLTDLVNSISEMAQIKISDAIDWIKKMIDELTYSDEEKQYLKNVLIKSEDSILKYVAEKRFANKGMAQEPKPFLIDDMQLESAEGPAMSGSQKTDMHLKTFFPLWKSIADESGFSKEQVERMFHQMASSGTFSVVRNEELYQAWLLTQDDGDPLKQSIINTLKVIPVSTAVSIFDFYSNVVLARQIGVVIDRDGRISTSLLNTSESYSDFISNFESNIVRLGARTIKDLSLRHKRELDTKFSNYKMLSPEEKIAKKKEQFESDLDYLQEVTSIPRETWRSYFVEQTKETFSYQNEGDPSPTNFKSFENLMENETYRKGSDGKFYPWQQSNIVFTLLHKKEVRPYQKSDREFISAFKNYFTTGDDTRNVFSNLYKLVTSQTESNNIGLSGSNIKGDRFSSFLQYNDIFDTAANIQNTGVDNHLVAFYKTTGRKMEFTILNGIHNRAINKSREGNTSDQMSTEDIWVSMLTMFGQGDDTYLHNIGQFSDKSTIYLLDVPKVIDDEERLNEAIELLEGKDNFEKIRNKIKYNTVILNQILFKEYSQGPHDINYGEYNKFITDFLVNYVLNTKDTQQLFFGEYNLESYKNGYVDLVKRSGSSNSPGYRLNTNIEGGLGDHFSFAIANEQFLPDLRIKESMDGQIFMRGSFASRAQVSMGSVYAKKDKYPLLDSLKAVMSFKHKDTNLRELTKANIINIDVLAELLGGVYKDIADYMKKNSIDILSMPSSSKIRNKGSVIDLFDDNGKVNSNAVAEIGNYIVSQETSTLFVQQDLRHPTAAKKTSMPSQFLTNMFTLQNSGQIIGYISELQRLGLEKLKRQLSDTDLSRMQFLVKNVNEFTQSDLSGLLGKGLTIDDPAYRNLMHTIMASAISRLALDIPISRVTTQEIADAEGILKPLRKTKDEKHTLLPEIITGIDGARESKLFKGDKKQAIAYILVNASQYQDLIDETGVMEWELENTKDGVIIPGEIIISTRVPADGLHSHTVARLKKNIQGHNFTMLDRVSQLASGSDFDGDYRFNQTFFKKDGIAVTDLDSAEGIANEIMMLVVHSYMNPDLFDSIIRPINTKAYDSIVNKLSPERKNRTANRFDPFSYENSRLNNMVGVVMKGIMTDHMTTFSLLNRYKLKIKSQLRIVYGDQVEKNVINIDQIASDKYGAMKAHLSNLLNLAFDNAKDPKIEIMGLNEITANMFIMALITNSKNSSDNFKNFNTNYNAILGSIEQLTEYFTSPVVKRFVAHQRRRAGGMRNEDSDVIKKRLIAESKEDYGFSQSEVENLFELFYAAAELSDMRSLYRLTQSSPITYADYIAAKHIVRKVKTFSAKNGGMKYFDTKPLFVEDRDDPRGYRFVTELDVAEKVIEFAQDNVFNDIIEESKPGIRIISHIFNILKTADPKRIELRKKELNVLSNALGRVFNIMSLDSRKTYSQVWKELKQVFPLLKQEFPEDMSSQEREQYKLYENNEFLKFIRFVTKKKGVGYDAKMTTRIQVNPEYTDTRIPDNKLSEIRKDFDKLPENIKDLFASYVFYEYGANNVTSNGGFFSLFGDNYRIELSKNMSKEKQRWINDELSSSEQYRIAKWVQRIINNKQLRNADAGVTFSPVADYYSEPLLKEPISSDALEAIENVNTINPQDALSEISTILEEHNISSLSPLIRRLLNLPEESPVSATKQAIPAIKTFREQQIALARKYFPMEDQSEKPVRDMYASDAVMNAMITGDKGLQEFIYSHLQKLYPGLQIFTDRNAFYEFVRKNSTKMQLVNPTAIGHAFKNAIFIDPDSSVQEIMFHEMSHIYWDALPADHSAKGKLRELYKKQYPLEDYDLDEIDEMIMIDIGHAGTDNATRYLSPSFIDRFMNALKEFWISVKQFFGKYSKTDLINDMVKNIYQNRDKISIESPEGNAEIRNLITYDNSDIGAHRDASRHTCVIGNIHLPGITNVIKRFEFVKFDPEEQLHESMRKFISDYKKKTGIEPTPEMIVDEIEGLKLKWSQDGQAGSKIHSIAEYVFTDKPIPQDVKDSFSGSNVLTEYIKSLQQLKKELIKKYPDARFYTEQDLISTKYKLFGIADLIVDIGDNKLIVFDFKTTDKEFKDKDGNLSDVYTKNYGMMKAPISNIKQSKKTEHALQLSIEALILEEQENKLNPGEKNEVVGLYVMPIIREVNENGLITKARLSNIVEIPGTDLSYMLDNAIEHRYEKNLANSILIKFAEIYKDIENIFPTFDAELQKAGITPALRKELLSAYSYLSTVSGTPLSEITHETMQDIQNNGMRKLYSTLLDLNYDQNDINTLPFEVLLHVAHYGIAKNNFKENEKSYYRNVVVDHNSKKVLNPKRIDNLHYHLKVRDIDLYFHEAGTKTVKKGDRVIEIFQVKGAKKTHNDYATYRIVEINAKYKTVTVINEDNNVEKKIYQVEGKEGILLYDDKPHIPERHVTTDNYVPRYITIDEPIEEQHWNAHLTVTPEMQASQAKLWSFFGEYKTRKDILELMNDMDEMKEIYTSLSIDEGTRPLMDFLREILLNHYMATQIRIENKFGPSSMMPMTLNTYYLLTKPESVTVDFDGWWSHARMWQPARMLQSEYVPFNFLMYGVENSLRRTAEEQYDIRRKIDKFLNDKDKKIDLENVINIRRGERFWRLPTVKNISANEREFLTLIYEHYYTYVQKYKAAKKASSKQGGKGYPLPIPVTKVFSTRQEIKDNPKIGRKWGDIIFELMQPSMYDDVMVELVEKKDGEYKGIRKFAKWKDIKEEFAFENADEETRKEWLGKRWRHSFRHLPWIRKSAIIPGKLYYYYNKARTIYQNGDIRNKKASEKQRRITSMHSLHTIYQTRYLIEAEEKVMESNIFSYFMKRIVAPIDYITAKYGDKTKAEQYIREFTDFVIFKKGKSFDTEITGLIDFLTKTNSLAKIAWSPKTNVFNFLIGQSMDIMREPGAYMTGNKRLLTNFRKCINIVKRYGVGTVVDDARFDELARAAGIHFSFGDKHGKMMSVDELATLGYWPMDFVEKANQLPIFIGLMTDKEFAAYNDEGEIIDPSSYDHLSPYRRERLSSTVKSIHGDYRPENAAPFWNTNFGRSVLQFRKWMPAMLWEEVAPYHYDRAYMVRSGVLSAVSMLAMVITFNVKSDKNKAKIYEKIITEKWPDEEKAQLFGASPEKLFEMRERSKLNLDRQRHVINSTRDYVDMLIAERNAGRISIKEDFSENDRKKLWAAAVQLMMFTLTTMTIAAMSAGGKDEKRFWKGTQKSLLAFFLRYRQDLFVYALPDQWTSIAQSPIAYFDAVINMAKFTVDFSSWIVDANMNFIDTWKDQGYDEAMRRGMWSDKAIFEKPGPVLEQGKPKFIKDALGFIPAGGLFRFMLQQRQKRLVQGASVINTLEKENFNPEVIEAIKSQLDEKTTWAELDDGYNRYEAFMSAYKKAIKYAEMENKDLLYTYRDIQNYLTLQGKIVDKTRGYLMYKGLEDKYVTDKDYYDRIFDYAKKWDGYIKSGQYRPMEKIEENFEYSKNKLDMRSKFVTEKDDVNNNSDIMKQLTLKNK